jgi:hypothetical protein
MCVCAGQMDKMVRATKQWVNQSYNPVVSWKRRVTVE